MQRLLLLALLLLHQHPVQPDDQPPNVLHLHVNRKQVVSGGSRVYVVCGGHRHWTWSNLKRRGLQLVAVDAINNQQSDCVPPHLGWDERASVIQEFIMSGDNKDYYEEEDSDEYNAYDVEHNYEEDSGQVSSHPHQKSLQSVERETGGREAGEREARGCEGTSSSTQVLIVFTIVISLSGHLLTCLYLRHLAYHVKRECAREAVKSLSLIQPRVSPQSSGRGQDDSERGVEPSDISLDD